MRYFNNFTESNWVQQYKYTDQTWLVDSLNWEKLTTVSLGDFSLVSFVYNSSFINQHFMSDYAAKLSHLDVVLLNTNSWNLGVSVLYNAFVNDLYLFFTVKYLPTLSLFSSSYQDIFSLVLLLSPEVTLVFSDYFTTYLGVSSTNHVVSACFDSYTSNLNYNFGEGIISLFMFFFFLDLLYIFF